MLYLTCTTITSVGLAHYGLSRVKDWVSGDCGTTFLKQSETFSQYFIQIVVSESWPRYIFSRFAYARVEAGCYELQVIQRSATFFQRSQPWGARQAREALWIEDRNYKLTLRRCRAFHF